MITIVVIILSVFSTNVDLVIVKLDQGILRGEILKRSTGNGIYYSFKGIPYAAPPVGNLRFKAPQPPLPWIGERSAIAHGSTCPQLQIGTNIYIPGNEDCLFLNVYTPTIEPENPLPVMFYIHGGCLISGSGNAYKYRPDFLIDHDVIVVTINYRLGALGFLSLDIEEVPGNAGLKDQVAALQWVQKNIANFGGDPGNVTIFGDSSGGSSVSLHVLSSMSQGLFKRAISMSGVFLNDWFLPFEPKKRALLFTQQLGLFTEDPVKALTYLQNVPVRSLVVTKPFVLYSEQPRNDVLEIFPFTPVVEKRIGNVTHFMTEDPEKLLSECKTHDVDLILGNTAKEGTFRAVTRQRYIFNYYPLYKELIVPSKITNKEDPRKILKLADRIQNHYFGNKEISKENMKELIDFFSYFMYVYDIHRFVEMWTKCGNKAYFYEFSCFSERNIYGKYGIKYGIREATRLDDLTYLFDGIGFLLPLHKNRPSYKMIVQTCTLYTNFAKYGNPTPNSSLGAIWMDYSKNNSYFDIGYELIPKFFDNKPQIDFWRSIFQSAGLMFS